MALVQDNFRTRVESVVADIPKGRLMTYGQLAALCGNARAARVVGGIAHFGDPTLPWHRVVSKSGLLASGYPGGRKAHAAQLTKEGVSIDSDSAVINVLQYIWQPFALEEGNR